jgi:hypothetical protein
MENDLHKGGLVRQHLATSLNKLSALARVPETESGSPDSAFRPPDDCPRLATPRRLPLRPGVSLFTNALKVGISIKLQVLLLTGSGPDLLFGFSRN